MVDINECYMIKYQKEGKLLMKEKMKRKVEREEISRYLYKGNSGCGVFSFQCLITM